MIRLRVPEGEPVELVFAHGEKAFVRYDRYTLALDVRVEAPRDRRIRWMWQPANLVLGVAEALRCQVFRER